MSMISNAQGTAAEPDDGLRMDLPTSLKAERRGNIAVLWLARAHKRNALDRATVLGIEMFFGQLPDDIRAVVLAGEGEHFCAGADLRDMSGQDIAKGIAHSQNWHRAFERIEFGRTPVVAVLHGAVIGGGLEIAAACHLRVAEQTAYYALPEASRGIFVGGGGSLRLPRLIGMGRVTDMMLTGRTYDAEEGQAVGISQYLVEPGAGITKAIELARHVANNPPMSNYAITQVLPRIVSSNPASGYLTEAMIAAITQASDEADVRLRGFLEKVAQKTLRRTNGE